MCVLTFAQVRARNAAGWSPFSTPPLTVHTSGKLSAVGCLPPPFKNNYFAEL